MTNVGLTFDLAEQAQELAQAVRDMRGNLSPGQIGPDTDLTRAALKIENAAKYIRAAAKSMQ